MKRFHLVNGNNKTHLEIELTLIICRYHQCSVENKVKEKGRYSKHIHANKHKQTTQTKFYAGKQSKNKKS